MSFRDSIWVTADGRVYRLRDMHERHLLNSIRFMQRNAENVLRQVREQLPITREALLENNLPRIYNDMLAEARHRGIVDELFRPAPALGHIVLVANDEAVIRSEWNRTYWEVEGVSPAVPTILDGNYLEPRLGSVPMVCFVCIDTGMNVVEYVPVSDTPTYFQLADRLYAATLLRR